MKTPFIQSVCLPEMSRTPDVITPLIEKILYRARAGRVVSIQVLENTPTKRHHTVNSEFFTSIGFTPMGGMVRLYNTRKGKSVRLLCEVFNIPPASLKTGKSHKGVRQMNTTTSASAQSATPSTNSNPILTESEQASENAAMAKMFAEVRKAEAQAREPQVTAAQSVDKSIDAVCDTSNVLFELWKRTERSLSKSELSWFAKSAWHAHQETNNLRDILSGLGCLISADTQSGALQDKSSLSSLLFSVSTQLDTIGGMLEIGNAATDRLLHPEIYSLLEGRIDPHSPDALALLYPPSDEPFAVWFNKTAAEENSPNPWAANDATGQAAFDLPSLDAAQLVAVKLKHRNAVVSVMKGGAK